MSRSGASAGRLRGEERVRALLHYNGMTGMSALGNATLSGTKTPWSNPRFVLELDGDPLLPQQRGRLRGKSRRPGGAVAERIGLGRETVVVIDQWRLFACREPEAISFPMRRDDQNRCRRFAHRFGKERKNAAMPPQ